MPEHEKSTTAVVNPTNLLGCLQRRNVENSTLSRNAKKMRISKSQLVEETRNSRIPGPNGELPRKVSKGLQNNQRIDQMFHAMRQKQHEPKQLQKQQAVPSSEKENHNSRTRTAVTVCMESIRKLMEEQTLDEEKLTSSAAISRIPEGTRLAFCNYNGAWSQEHPEIADKIVLKPMFERDDADHGEFHLFYKRILHYLLIRDAKQTAGFKDNCLSRSDLKPSVRATLFDWMIKVQVYLRMRTETLHMATTLVDQYMSYRKIFSAKYQLVGITAIFVACKVNERVPPSLQTLCHLTEDAFTPKEILRFEEKMLSALDFDVNVVSPHSFLETALLACDDLNAKLLDLVRLISVYLFDLGLTEFRLARFPASLRAAAAVFLSRRLARLHEEQLPAAPTSDYESPQFPESPAAGIPLKQLWTSELCDLTGHANDKRLRAVALIYASALANVQQLFKQMETDKSTEWLEAAFVKYGSRCYFMIARDPLLTTFHYANLLTEWCSDEQDEAHISC